MKRQQPKGPNRNCQDLEKNLKKKKNGDKQIEVERPRGMHTYSHFHLVCSHPASVVVAAGGGGDCSAAAAAVVAVAAAASATASTGRGKER